MTMMLQILTKQSSSSSSLSSLSSSSASRIIRNYHQQQLQQQQQFLLRHCRRRQQHHHHHYYYHVAAGNNDKPLLINSAAAIAAMRGGGNYYHHEQQLQQRLPSLPKIILRNHESFSFSSSSSSLQLLEQQCQQPHNQQHENILSSFSMMSSRLVGPSPSPTMNTVANNHHENNQHKFHNDKKWKLLPLLPPSLPASSAPVFLSQLNFSNHHHYYHSCHSSQARKKQDIGMIRSLSTTTSTNTSNPTTTAAKFKTEDKITTSPASMSSSSSSTMNPTTTTTATTAPSTSTTSTTTTTLPSSSSSSSQSRMKDAPPSTSTFTTNNTTTSSSSSSSTTTTTTAAAAATAAATTLLKKSTVVISTFTKYLYSLLRKTPSTLYYYATHPTEFQSKLREWKELAIKEAHHYYMGSKLLVADVRTAKQLLGRTLRGSTLSRRERKQLLRTVTDVFRLVPMSIFVLVPFMELALPIALKFFPNMLPSTFQDSLKEEEKMKGELQMRISMAGFFQDTLAELAKEQKKFAQQLRDTDSSSSSSSSTTNNASSNTSAGIQQSDFSSSSLVNEKEASATSFLSFLQKARTGQAIPPEVIIKFAKYFEDNLTLDNMGRMQLINMCKYMGIPPYGNDNLLRFQLRHRIRLLKDDDQRILWEGIDSLTKMELREACRERGMRSTGLSKAAYRMALQQWLELSVQKDVPISLLIMSRTFFLHDEMLVGSGGGGGVAGGTGGGGEEGVGGTIVGGSTNDGVIGLADAMSGIDKEVLNEIVLEMASSKEKSSNADVIKIQLEVLEHQNELIKEEQEERDAAMAKKLKEEKEKSVTSVAAAAASAAAASVGGGEKDVSRDDGTRERMLLKEMDTTIITGIGVPTNADVAGSPLTKDIASAILPKESTSLSSSSTGSVVVVDEDVQTELSTEEIDAISQLTSPDPVLREREELKRIKCKMQSESAGIAVVDSSEEGGGALLETSLSSGIASSSTTTREPVFVDEPQGGDDKATKDMITEAAPTGWQGDATTREAARKEGRLDTTTTTTPPTTTPSYDEEHEVVVVGDIKLQKAIDRLKSRVESMVGKIESRLSDIEVKIGNKFHLLDKDGDGVLTMEEMAQVLQTVLKRELTPEEAMAIASDMDQNKDGVFSIAELAQWAETNTIVKLAEDGREKDLDDMITERVANLHERKEQQYQNKVTEEPSSKKD